jgi:hypothetical protein
VITNNDHDYEHLFLGHDIVPEVEDTVVQIYQCGRWVDYSRCTRTQARRWIHVKGRRQIYRLVDWISKLPVE